jgi:hypothetical protein
LLGLGGFFSVLIVYTVGKILWTRDQPVARPLSTHRMTQTENKCTQRDIHALSTIRTHDPSFRGSEDISCLKPYSHCDRPKTHVVNQNYKVVFFNITRNLLPAFGLTVITNEVLRKIRMWMNYIVHVYVSYIVYMSAITNVATVRTFVALRQSKCNRNLYQCNLCTEVYH